MSGCQKIGMDGIVNEGEVAALFTIAEDHRLPSGQQRFGKCRNRRSVGTVGVLPGTEDIEVAGNGCVQSQGYYFRYR